MNSKQKRYQDKRKQPVAWVGKMKGDKDWRWSSVHKSSVEDTYDIVAPLYLSPDTENTQAD